jgi:hypothetical protein
MIAFNFNWRRYNKDPRVDAGNPYRAREDNRVYEAEAYTRSRESST